MLKNAFKRYDSDPDVRRSARWRKLHKRARHDDFQLYRPHLIWPSNERFKQASRAWKAIPGLPDDRRFFLLSTAASVRSVEGDTADIGVRFGTSSFFILCGIDDAARQHHLFDSFEGLSEPTPEDRDAGGQSVWKQGHLLAEEEVTKKNLRMYEDRCRYYKGWVPARFAEVQDRRFAFVHIDVDLYQPTRDTLEFFYERTSPGGVIVCDDYGSALCPGARKAMDEFLADKPEALFHIPTGQALIVKR
ncbi:MAG TPA: TylF/MycF/NovP-related O-methyltransferase [Rubrivivax sp.]|nr:TylF/MycF/NovP-related O-methyltransferase [Rubrivivax sp.]